MSTTVNPETTVIFEANACSPQIVAQIENPAIPISSPEAWRSVFGGEESASGVEVTAKTAMGYSPLWRAVNLVAGDVSRLPLNVYRRMPNDGREVDTKHPAQPLVRRKSSPVTRAQILKKTLTYHALIHGNGYAAILRDNRNRPMELLILDPQGTYPVIDDGQVFYVTTIRDNFIPLRGQDVFHIRGLSHDGLVGHSVIDLLADSLGVGIAATRCGAKFFKEGLMASGILMVPGHFKPDAVKNLLKAWTDSQRGLSNAHKVALLQDGAKFQQLTMAPEHAQFLQTRQFEVRTVANIVGCPPHKLGDDSRTSHASLEQENQSYLDDCLDHWLIEWESECDDKLLLDGQQDSHYCEFNRNAILRLDYKTRIQGYYRLKEIGVFNTNDILRSENRPTIGEEGETRYRPKNWVRVGSELDMDEAPDPPAPQPGEESEDSEDTPLQSIIRAHAKKTVSIERERYEKAVSSGHDIGAWAGQYYESLLDRASLPGMDCSAALGKYAVLATKQLRDSPHSLDWSAKSDLLTDLLMESCHD